MREPHLQQVFEDLAEQFVGSKGIFAVSVSPGEERLSVHVNRRRRIPRNTIDQIRAAARPFEVEILCEDPPKAL
jgi:hypothetical protein